MKIYYLTRKQVLPIDQETAWAFFSNPANLAELSPPWAGMIDESHETPKAVFPGMVQILRIRMPGGLPCRWIAEITHVEAPHRFIDIQRSGPFAYWLHRHELFPAGDNRTEIRDTVHYALPFGPLGQLVHALFVERQVGEMFDYRARMLEEFFGA